MTTLTRPTAPTKVRQPDTSRETRPQRQGFGLGQKFLKLVDRVGENLSRAEGHLDQTGLVKGGHNHPGRNPERL